MAALNWHKHSVNDERRHYYLTMPSQYHLRLLVAQGLILNCDSLSGAETKAIAADIMNGDDRLVIQGNKYVLYHTWLKSKCITATVLNALHMG